MSLIDCGVNLVSAQFTSKQAVLSSGLPEVNRFVLISSQLSDVSKNLADCQKYTGCITTAGIHPHHAETAEMDFIQQLRDLCAADHGEVSAKNGIQTKSKTKIRAIGECGLDYNRNFSSPEKQRRVFAAQVALAVELQLPLYLHERDALADQLAILSEHQGNLPPLLVHCFTGGPDELAAYQAFDAYFSVNGWLCDPKRGANLRAAVPQISSERLLLETDAPYLTPKLTAVKLLSLEKSASGWPVNLPRTLPYIAQEVARLRAVSYADLIGQTTQNAERLFGAWPSQYQDKKS